MRVAFVIHSLGRGGSERQLITLATGLAGEGHDVAVFVLRGGGALEGELQARNISCIDLSRERPWYRPAALFGLVRAIRRRRPDVVHSYLVVANLLVVLLRPVLGRVRLVWGLRAAGEGRYHPLAGLAFAATRLTARIPDLVIANSEAGRRYHARRGYPPHKVVVIENGIDGTNFRHDAAGRDELRHDWGVSPDAPLVGLVGRLDHLKDHETFLRAAAEAAQDASIRFVCVGVSSGPRYEQLEQLAGRLGLSDRLVWTEHRDDMAAVYSALDVCCLSSISEGFPNVVAEAMACGTPCVVTDVGDAAAMVEGLGGVVPPRDPRALARGMQDVLMRVAEEGSELGDRVRERIVSRYSVPRLVRRTEQSLRALIEERHSSSVGSQPMPASPAHGTTEVFAFGENWQRFLATIDERRVEQATSDLAAMLEHKDLEGASFLDIGSGSGLSSLAARRLGARVHSFDFDAESVACTAELRRRHDRESENWTVEAGSVLDRSYLSKLGSFDVVYSWGVLHHTGGMWEAMGNVVDLVAPGGTLFIALYNDQGRRSQLWRWLKRAYVRGPSLLQPLLLTIPFTVYWLPRIALDSLSGSPLRSWRAHADTRGMSAWHDLVDWAGGYPFEVASPGVVHSFYRERGFRLERLVTRNGIGCNEYVFVREDARRPD